jgi:hypothetical protein
MDERGLLDHSTVWRMLTWLGCQLAALATGRELIQQRDPNSTCHRSSHRRVGRTVPGKVLSSFRHKIGLRLTYFGTP